MCDSNKDANPNLKLQNGPHQSAIFKGNYSKMTINNHQSTNFHVLASIT